MVRRILPPAAPAFEIHSHKSRTDSPGQVGGIGNLSTIFFLSIFSYSIDLDGENR